MPCHTCKFGGVTPLMSECVFYFLESYRYAMGPLMTELRMIFPQEFALSSRPDGISTASRLLSSPRLPPSPAGLLPPSPTGLLPCSCPAVFLQCGGGYRTASATCMRGYSLKYGHCTTVLLEDLVVQFSKVVIISSKAS